MSITDVLSADDIAAALQECQGEGGLEEQGVVALWGPEQDNKFSGAWTTSDSSSQNKHTGLGCPPGVSRDLGSIPAWQRRVIHTCLPHTREMEQEDQEFEIIPGYTAWTT